MEPIAIILNGASSAGKTSIAKALQEIWPAPLIHASLDTFTDVFNWSNIELEEARQRCHAMGVDSFHDYLDRISVSEFPIVVDHVFEQREWHDRTLEVMNRRPTVLVAVRGDLEVLEQREKKRGDRRTGLARWQHQRVHENVVYDFEIDTGTKNPTECANVIMNFFKKQDHNHDSQP